MAKRRPADKIDARASARSLLNATWDDRRIYSGTKDELIAAGLAREGDFPGDPGGPIASRMIKRDDQRKYISIHSRKANPITFWLHVYKTPLSKEKEGRPKRHRRRIVERKALARASNQDTTKAREYADSAIANLPSSPAEYAARVMNVLRGSVRKFVRAALMGEPSAVWQALDGYNPLAGYRIDADSLAAFDEAIDEAAAVLRDARVIADKKSRESAITAIRGKAARGDPEFAGFMRQIMPPQAERAAD